MVSFSPCHSKKRELLHRIEQIFSRTSKLSYTYMYMTTWDYFLSMICVHSYLFGHDDFVYWSFKYKVPLAQNLSLPKKSAHHPALKSQIKGEILGDPYGTLPCIGQVGKNHLMKNLMDHLPHGNVHNIPHGTRIGSVHSCRDKLKFEEGRYRYTLNTTKNLEAH